MTHLNPAHYINRMAYTNTRWRECVIWVRTTGGVRECNANVFGAFGIHESMDELAGFVLTHIPTGRQAHRSVLRVLVQQHAERLTALGDWNTTSASRLLTLREAM